MTLLKSWNSIHRKQARTCIDLLQRSANVIDEQVEKRAVSWNHTTDLISGAAGIGLFLLEADFRTWRAKGLAIEAGNGLLATAERVELDDGNYGLRWKINPELERVLPNFSHGTAGICFFLVELHSICEIYSEEYEFAKPGFQYDGRFGQAALAGARYLASLDAKHGALGHIPHHFPDGEQLFYLGWCHGPPGTCQLANALPTVEGSEFWEDYSKTATDSLLRSALHKNRTEGFWNNVGLCCGSAGAGSFLVDQSRRHDEPKYLDESRQIADDILARGKKGVTEQGFPTICWPSSEHRVRPDFIQTQTGLMQGAAGIGLFLLQLEAEHRGDEKQFSVFKELMR